MFLTSIQSENQNTVKMFINNDNVILKIGQDAAGRQHLEVKQKGFLTWFLARVLKISSYQFSNIAKYIEQNAAEFRKLEKINGFCEKLKGKVNKFNRTRKLEKQVSDVFLKQLDLSLDLSNKIIPAYIKTDRELVLFLIDDPIRDNITRILFKQENNNLLEINLSSLHAYLQLRFEHSLELRLGDLYEISKKEEVIEELEKIEPVRLEHLFVEQNITCRDKEQITLTNLQKFLLKKYDYFKAFFKGNFQPSTHLDVSKDLLELIVLDISDAEKHLSEHTPEKLIDLLTETNALCLERLEKIVATECRRKLLNLYEPIGTPIPFDLGQIPHFSLACELYKYGAKINSESLMQECQIYFSALLTRAYRSSNSTVFFQIMYAVQPLGIEELRYKPSSLAAPKSVNPQNWTKEQWEAIFYPIGKLPH